VDRAPVPPTYESPPSGDGWVSPRFGSEAFTGGLVTPTVVAPLSLLAEDRTTLRLYSGR